MIKLNNSENFFSEMHSIQTSKYFLEEKKLGFMYIFPKIFFEFLLIVSFVLVIISTNSSERFSLFLDLVKFNTVKN